MTLGELSFEWEHERFWHHNLAFLVIYRSEEQLQPAVVNLSLETAFNIKDIFWVLFSGRPAFCQAQSCNFFQPLALPVLNLCCCRLSSACPSQWLFHLLVLSPSTFTAPKPILPQKVPRWCANVFPLHQVQVWRDGRTTVAPGQASTLWGKKEKKKERGNFSFILEQNLHWLEKSQDFTAGVLLHFSFPCFLPLYLQFIALFSPQIICNPSARVSVSRWLYVFLSNTLHSRDHSSNRDLWSIIRIQNKWGTV